MESIRNSNFEFLFWLYFIPPVAQYAGPLRELTTVTLSFKQLCAVLNKINTPLLQTLLPSPAVVSPSEQLLQGSLLRTELNWPAGHLAQAAVGLGLPYPAKQSKKTFVKKKLLKQYRFKRLIQVYFLFFLTRNVWKCPYFSSGKNNQVWNYS